MFFQSNIKNIIIKHNIILVSLLFKQCFSCCFSSKITNNIINWPRCGAPAAPPLSVPVSTEPNNSEKLESTYVSADKTELCDTI